jgi:hypothetical protein
MSIAATIIDWNAKRAGGRITLTGIDRSNGEPIKVTGVDRIYGPKTEATFGDARMILALGKDGKTYQLA